MDLGHLGANMTKGGGTSRSSVMVDAKAPSAQYARKVPAELEIFPSASFAEPGGSIHSRRSWPPRPTSASGGRLERTTWYYAARVYFGTPSLRLPCDGRPPMPTALE